MERACVDVLGISDELERQPAAPHVVIGVFEDASRFRRRLDRTDAESVQPVLKRTSAARKDLAEIWSHGRTMQDTPMKERRWGWRLISTTARPARKVRSGIEARRAGSAGRAARMNLCDIGERFHASTRLVLRGSASQAGLILEAWARRCRDSRCSVAINRTAGGGGTEIANHSRGAAWQVVCGTGSWFARWSPACSAGRSAGP